MISNETKQKLITAETLEEVKELLKDEPGLNPDQVFDEINNAATPMPKNSTSRN